MNVSKNQALLFPSETGTNLSHEFMVRQHPVVVRAFGLIEGQRVMIEQGILLPCGDVRWGPHRICCQVELTPTLTQIVLGVTGLYRAYISDPNEDGIDDIAVAQYPAMIAQETTTCC